MFDAVEMFILKSIFDQIRVWNDREVTSRAWSKRESSESPRDDYTAYGSLGRYFE